MSTIAAYTIGGITVPELFLDPTGNRSDPDAQASGSLGIGALYGGCRPASPILR